jgi:uncharacterized hydantoinase/oxoprolinase family protein
MYKVNKVCPAYVGNVPDKIDYIGEADTITEAFEVLRDYFWNANKAIVAHPDAPRAIVELAAASLVANSTLVFETVADGVVHVNGRAPEMDYFQIV